MFLEPNKDGEWPETFKWRGVYFEKKRPRHDQSVLYESGTVGNWCGAILYQYKISRQWTAMFSVGVCSLESDYEDALISAAQKQIDNCRYDMARIHAILKQF